MKNITIFTAVLVLSLGVLMADFPGFKFVAPMEGVSVPAEGPWILTVMATSSQTIDLFFDEDSEIEVKHGGSLTPGGLAALPAGTILKIRAAFTEAGMYVRELEVFKDERDFELRGSLESVDCVAGVIVLFGHEIHLNTDTVIRSADSDLLSCADLAPEQFVDVKGRVYDSEFWATEIKVGVPGEEHLLMEFDAVVLEMTESEWLVSIQGGKEKTPVPVLVLLDDNTQVEGVVAVGMEVEVTGVLTPELAVLAKIIRAEGLDDADDNGNEGDEGEEGGGQVQEMEIKWTPDVIRSAPNGARTVRLMLKHGIAEEDLEVSLAADLSLDLVIEFDSLVTIPSGERSVEVEIRFLSESGSGTLTASLPAGASDELDIELKPSGKGGDKGDSGDEDDDDEDEDEEEDDEDGGGDDDDDDE